MSEIEIVDKAVHEILMHAEQPIHADEVTIPLLMDAKNGIELIRQIAAQLRAREETVWVSTNRMTLVHKHVRVYIDPQGYQDPVHIRSETLLMCVLEHNPETSKYAAGVLRNTLRESLTSALFAGYQGYILYLKEEEDEPEDED